MAIISKINNHLMLLLILQKRYIYPLMFEAFNNFAILMNMVNDSIEIPDRTKVGKSRKI